MCSEKRAIVLYFYIIYRHLSLKCLIQIINFTATLLQTSCCATCCTTNTYILNMCFKTHAEPSAINSFLRYKVIPKAPTVALLLQHFFVLFLDFCSVFFFICFICFVPISKHLHVHTDHAPYFEVIFFPPKSVLTAS